MAFLSEQVHLELAAEWRLLIFILVKNYFQIHPDIFHAEKGNKKP